MKMPTEIILRKLKENGLKATPQRIAILRFLDQTMGHPSVEEIHQAIKKQYPSISLATVYNTLEKLNKAHSIQKLNISDARAHYETNLNPHCHFYCKQCQTIIDITLTRPFESDQLDHYRVEEIHGYFKGVCEDCLIKGGEKCQR